MKPKESSKLNPFLFFLLMTAFGVLLVMRSEMAPDMVIRILGAGSAAGGLILIIGYLRSSGGGDSYLRRVCGTLIIAGGILILIRTEYLSGFFRALMGIAVMLNGFLNMTRSLDYLKIKTVGWRVPLTLSLITMGGAAVIMVSPFPSDTLLMKVVGGLFLYNALTSLWIHTRRPRRSRYRSKDQEI